MSQQLTVRIEALETRVLSVLSNIPPEARSEEQRRVEAAFLALGLRGSAIFHLPGSLPLARRAAALAAPPDRLCKTLIFENLAAAAPGAAATTPRYVALIVQYVARVNLAALERGLAARAGSGGAAFKLALAQNGVELSGFPFNGVTPFGSRTPLMLVLPTAIARLGAPAP
jgi:prolyl-tRNA editing enzyme YbaK/EbsC (Cys-tRNA(Pro) deacylase)